MDAGVSGESQVSVRASASMLWSKMNSCRTVGLSRLSVTVVQDLVLMWEKIRLVVVAGPGLREMLPERMRRSLVTMENCLSDKWLVKKIDGLVKKFTGTVSKHLQTDEKGIGW